MQGDWDDRQTGYDVLLWLRANPALWPKDGVDCHSINPFGKSRMQCLLDERNWR